MDIFTATTMYIGNVQCVCHRYHVILRPLKEFLQEELGQSTCLSTSYCLAMTDFFKLTKAQLEDVCRWLTSRLVIFSGNITGCIKDNTRFFQATADGTAVTLGDAWLQYLQVSCRTGLQSPEVNALDVIL